MEATAQSNLLEIVEAHVMEHFRRHVDEEYVFHDFQHTYGVVEAADKIAEYYNLTPTDRQIVLLATWFHDLGYSEGWQGHEARSAQYAADFLRQHELEPGIIDQVKGCIQATRLPQNPQNLLEEIVCDADLSHLGNSYYWDRCGRVRQEFALTRGMIMSDQEWIDFELDFMLKHNYHTEAAYELFGEEKEKHIRQLLKQKRRLHPDQTPKDWTELQKSKLMKGKKKKKKKRSKAEKEIKRLNLGRGVETMYRTTYRTHVNLSSIADNKANIMLSVNAIIISIVVANLVPRLDGEPHLTIPTIILTLVCLVALTFAVLSTRPKVTEGRFTREDIEKKRSNLLFFGNFYNMKLEDFHWGMMRMIKDNEFLYSSMTRDLYYLGVVLAKKYRYLNICYTVFMIGLILSLIAFGIALAWAG
jgi:predicted metal-dependent HD superfamily phosphohydrolase